MKSSDLKVIAIILSIALFFTIVTSNAVSVASIVMLAKGGTGTTVQGGGTQTPVQGGTDTPVQGGTDTPIQGGTDTPVQSTDPTTPQGGNNTQQGGNNTQQGGNNATPQGGNNAQQGGTASTTWDKATAFNFYKKYAHAFKTAGNAAYNKKEWQVLSNLNLTGTAFIDDQIVNLAGNYMTTEDECEAQVCAKNSKEAKDRFPDCTLTDMSKVASATKTDMSNGNYKITIIMADEDTPKKSGNFLGQVTNSILYWEDIANELANISIVSNYEGNVKVLYKGFKIEAEMTKSGQFVSLKHTANVDILINGVKVVVTLNNKSGHLDNFCTYTDFKY